MFSYFLIRVLFGAVSALLGALIAQATDLPLPWLLGPLFFVGALRLLSVPVATLKPLRNVGQWIIGVSLGLYFSPDIGRLILEHWFVLVVGMVVALCLSILGSWLLYRFGRADIGTAWFSSAIGGASEMSVLAERYGARVDLVASAHSLRVLAVVTIIPFGFEFAGITGLDSSALSLSPVDYLDLLMVGTAATAFGLVFLRLRVASAWVLGPLVATALLTLLEVTNTAIPGWVVNGGQLFIGWSLGDRYRPAFFKTAPRFMMVVALFSIIAITLVGVIGLVVSQFSGLPVYSVWLGMAPGGLAEMAITAKVLMLGVPMVTAFQVSRMAFIVIVTAALYEKLIAPKIISLNNLKSNQ